IYQIASAVSGWWGGGLATILFSVLLTGIWALMESMADVAMLLSGKSVPFIKTKGTWYTSLRGNIEELFNTAIQDAQNAGITLLGKVKEGLTDAWKEVMKEMDGIYVEGMNEIMERMAVDISGQIEQNEVLLNQQFDEFIVECIEYKDSVNPFREDSDEYRLAEDIRMEINSFEEIESKDIVRQSIDDLFQLRIQEVLLASTEKLMNLVRLDMDVLKSMVKKEIEQGIDGAITQSTKIIEQKADEWKKTLFDEMDKEVSSKKTLLTQMISFDYKDYLRILLFSPGLSDEEKILRSMDLIQWNMQKNREDYELNLMNFFSGIDVRQKVAVDTWVLPSLTQEGINEQWYIECHEEVMY
ncbi:MAG: hypothetical protein JW708_01870, partial [Vallitaleaceae bacterium]|nr:hypothetical protein [Vallitaleaceae bacterium]